MGNHPAEASLVISLEFEEGGEKGKVVQLKKTLKGGRYLIDDVFAYGGMGIIYGPLLAALILVSGREFLRSNLSGQLESLYLAIYAVVLILIALFKPEGIATLLQDAYEKILSRIARGKNVSTNTPGL